MHIIKEDSFVRQLHAAKLITENLCLLGYICSSLKVNRCFGVIFRIHFQGPRINQARNRHKAVSKNGQILLCLVISYLTYSSTMKMEAHVLPKLWFTFNGLHGVIY
jgi:hypothetical protein